MGPVFGHVEAVFNAHTELSGQHEHRFVAEAHADLERPCVPPHQMDSLVSVEADSMPGPVGAAGQFVSGAVALSHIECARRRIHGLARSTERDRFPCLRLP